MNVNHFTEDPLTLLECVKYRRILRDFYLDKNLLPEMEIVKIANNSQETQWINDQLGPFRPGI